MLSYLNSPVNGYAIIDTPEKTIYVINRHPLKQFAPVLPLHPVLGSPIDYDTTLGNGCYLKKDRINNSFISLSNELLVEQLRKIRRPIGKQSYSSFLKPSNEYFPRLPRRIAQNCIFCPNIKKSDQFCLESIYKLGLYDSLLNEWIAGLEINGYDEKNKYVDLILPATEFENYEQFLIFLYRTRIWEPVSLIYKPNEFFRMQKLSIEEGEEMVQKKFPELFYEVER